MTEDEMIEAMARAMIERRFLDWGYEEEHARLLANERWVSHEMEARAAFDAIREHVVMPRRQPRFVCSRCKQPITDGSHMCRENEAD